MSSTVHRFLVHLKDLGWLPLLLMGLGGLSILDLIERYLYEGINLLTPFEILLNGYNRIVGVLSSIVEPLAFKTLSFINRHLNVNLDLAETWRPIFVLGMIYATAFWRGALRFGARLSAACHLISIAFFLLLGALSTGILHDGAGKLAQGLVASVPLLAFYCGWALAGAIENLNKVGVRQAMRRFSTSAFSPHNFRALAIVFVTAFALSYIPGLEHKSGVITFLIVILIGGCEILYVVMFGKAGNTPEKEKVLVFMSLSILGGFIAAMGVILSSVLVNSS